MSRQLSRLVFKRLPHGGTSVLLLDDRPLAIIERFRGRLDLGRAVFDFLSALLERTLFGVDLLSFVLHCSRVIRDFLPPLLRLRNLLFERGCALREPDIRLLQFPAP